MNNSVASIRTVLDTKLKEVIVSGQIAQVLIGRTMKFIGYPSVRFYLQSTEDLLKDNQPSNFREYTFFIDIFQETTRKSKQQAEIDMEEAVDAVLDKLNAEWDLDNNVEDTEIESGIIEERDFTFGPALQMTIIFTARTLIR